MYYGIGLIPQGDAGDMNSVEVIGFGITTAASDAEKEAAYKFIEWWNTQDKDGSSPALSGLFRMDSRHIHIQFKITKNIKLIEN